MVQVEACPGEKKTQKYQPKRSFIVWEFQKSFTKGGVGINRLMKHTSVLIPFIQPVNIVKTSPGWSFPGSV